MSETGASESLMLDDGDISDLCISQTDHFTSNDFEEIGYQGGLDCTSEEVMTTEETIIIESSDSPSTMEQIEIDGTGTIEMGETDDVEMTDVCEQEMLDEALEDDDYVHQEKLEVEEELLEEEVLEEMEDLEEEFHSPPVPVPAPPPPAPPQQIVYTPVTQNNQNVIFQTKPTLQKVPASTSLTMKQNVAAAAAAQSHQYMIVASPGGGSTNQLVKIVSAPGSSTPGHMPSVITAKSADGSIVQLRSAQSGKPLVATTQSPNIQVSNIIQAAKSTPSTMKRATTLQTGQQSRNVYTAKMLLGSGQSHQSQEVLIATTGHDSQPQTFKLITSSSGGSTGSNSGKQITLGQSQMNFVVQSSQNQQKIQNILPQKQQQQQQGVYVNKILQSTSQASRFGTMMPGKQTQKILPAPVQNQIIRPGSGNSQIAFTSSPKLISQPQQQQPQQQQKQQQQQQQQNQQKVIIRQSLPKAGGVIGGGQVIRLPAGNQSIVNSNQLHQIQMPGSRQVQYVRFVSTPSSSPTTSNAMTVGKPKTPMIQTIGVQHKVNSGQQQQQQQQQQQHQQQLVKVVPINSTNQQQQQQQLRTVVPKSTLVGTPNTTQRLIIPASSINAGGQNKNTVGIPASRISQLQSGQTILQTNSNVGNYVVLPAQFMQQSQQQHHQPPSHKPPVKHKTPFVPPPKDFLDPIKPPPAATPTVYNTPQKKSASSMAGNLSTLSESSHLPPTPATPATPRQSKSAASSPADANGLRPRKPCNCTKSQCLKLYCDCFANGEFCHNCNCNNCSNNLVNENERQRAIKSCLDRNPNAFRPKIGKGRDTTIDIRRHNKGCNCKRSGCLKNYCECYEAKIPCSNNCKCRGCRNVDDPITEKKSSKDLADAAEARTAQIMIEKARQIAGSAFRPQATSNSGPRQPFHFLTDKVVEITCQCLLAQAEEAEKSMCDEETSQRLVIEEFGRCLKEIIESAHKAEAASST